MASHPSPFHRQRQSNKTLDPTGQTAKFLYMILKQLDLKSIDWNEVASGLGITNGHAARMRWSRFRAQIEGLDNSYARKGYRKKDSEKKRKKDRVDDEAIRTQGQNEDGTGSKKLKKESDHIAVEGSMPYDIGGNNAFYRMLRREPCERTTVIDGVTVHHPTLTTVALPQSMSMPPTSTTAGPAYQSASLRAMERPPRTLANERKQLVNHQSLSSWPQQLVHTNYAHPSYNAYADPNAYRSPLATFNNHFQDAGAYVRHPHQDYSYRQQFVPSELHQSQAFKQSNYGYNMMDAVNSPHSNPMPTSLWQSRTPSQPRSGFATQRKSSPVFPTRTQHRVPSNLPTSTAVDVSERAAELAAHASYPWPFSKASLSQFTDQLSGSIAGSPMLDTIGNTEVTSDEFVPLLDRNEVDSLSIPGQTNRSHNCTAHHGQDDHSQQAGTIARSDTTILGEADATGVKAEPVEGDKCAGQLHENFSSIKIEPDTQKEH